MMENWMIQPVVQYGFLGFSVVLLGVVIWLIRKLLEVLEANNRIIAANTEAIRELTNMTCDLLKLHRSLHDKIISRPCIAREEA
ncbi:MAG TPA: hypothetical protein PLL20_01155 [Phycisphaerae bacterium]|nr:hypothetical protein [Phycisphaerae bacterium]